MLKRFSTSQLSSLLRRSVAKMLLRANEYLACITSFPTLGDGDYVDPPSERGGEVSQSMFVSDALISPHARFP